MRAFTRSAEKGFTLIELLVVISILGVLAVVVILNITKYIGAGLNETAATELQNVQTAVSAYMFDNSGAIPTNQAALSPYFLGTAHGTYDINQTTGKVTQTSYP
ncbi:MAG: prepilin-type N-terminal cleavage/methylation domain-containing protein [Dehalococcoidia bacterium]